MLKRIALVLMLAGSASLLLAPGNSHCAAADPPKEPILRLETGMHTAAIRRISVDRENRWLVTASDDKTVRLWELATGKLVMVLRPPMDAGNEGKIYSVAISPDGRQIACSGWTGWDWDRSVYIYIFDRKTGQMTGRITGLPEVVFHLAFSKGGHYLAACAGGKNGIRVYKTETMTLAGEDKDYGGGSYGADFAHDGRLVTSSADGYLRLYSRDFRLISKQKATGGTMPMQISFTPDGQRIAVGFHDSTKVEVLSARDLSRLYSPDTFGFNVGSFSSASWSADGSFLYAGGMYHDGTGCPIIQWANAGRGGRTKLSGSPNSILDICPLKGGGFAYGTSDPAWAVYDSTGNRRLYLSPSIADYREGQQSFLLSADGARVQFAYEFRGKSAARFSVDGRSLDMTREIDSALSPPITMHPNMYITDWWDKDIPMLNLKRLKLMQNEVSRSLAIVPGGESFLLGTEWRLRFFDKDGREKWQVPISGAALAVNVAGNKKLAVAALSDGTIRWYSLSDGKEILAFFPHRDRKRWVMWTPEGYFDASPGGADLIGYHLNQGKDKEARFIPLSNLYDVFYRPDIVQAKFKGEDISGLITLTAAEALATPPPGVRFTKVPPVNADKTAKVCYQIRGSGGGIGEVRLFQNGKLIKSDGFYREIVKKDSPRKIAIAALNSRAIYQDHRNIAIREKKMAGAVTNRSKGEAFDECVDIETIAGENEISLAAFNSPNTVQGMMETVTFASARQPDEPHLYILAVGIDKYRDPSINLKYAAKDSRDFIDKLPAKAGTVYKPVNIHVISLTDKQAGKQSILKTIEELSTKVKHGDGFIFFNASHGLLLQNQYYIVTADFNGNIENTDSLITSNEIVEMSKKIKSLSQLFIFDTCHAGGIDNIISGLYDARMVNLARKMGLHIYASAGSVQSAIDGYRGNGLYTYTLLQGIVNGIEVDKAGEGRVTIKTLGEYSRKKTTEISTKLGHAQTPYIINFGRDNTLFLVK